MPRDARLYLVVGLLAAMFCGSDCAAQPGRIDPAEVKQNGDWSVWRSKHWEFGVAWKPPMKFLAATNTVDTARATMVTLLDRQSASSVVATVTPDVPAATLSNEVYFDALKRQQMADPARRFVGQADTTFSGIEFTELTFRTVGGKGPAAIRVLVNRDGEQAVMLMFTFLVDADDDSVPPLPPMLAGVRVKLE